MTSRLTLGSRPGASHRQRMPLEHVILGLLVERPRHGYELWRWLEETLGPRTTLQRAHVYRVLAKLAHDRLVVVRGEPEAGPATRRTYQATGAGRARLRAWLTSQPRSARPWLARPLLVKAALRTYLGERATQHVVLRERAARQSLLGQPASPAGLGSLLQARARRHLAVELWLLDELATRVDA